MDFVFQIVLIYINKNKKKKIHLVSQRHISLFNISQFINFFVSSQSQNKMNETRTRPSNNQQRMSMANNGKIKVKVKVVDKKNPNEVNLPIKSPLLKKASPNITKMNKNNNSPTMPIKKIGGNTSSPKPEGLGKQIHRVSIQENQVENKKQLDLVAPDLNKTYAEAIESSTWEDTEEGYMVFEFGDRFLVLEKMEGKYRVKSVKTNQVGIVPSSKFSIISNELNANQIINRGRNASTYHNLQMYMEKVKNPKQTISKENQSNITTSENQTPTNGSDEKITSSHNQINTSSNPIEEVKKIPQDKEELDNDPNDDLSSPIVLQHRKLSDLLNENESFKNTMRGSFLDALSIFGKKLSSVMKGSVLPTLVETIFQTLEKIEGFFFFSDIEKLNSNKKN